MRKRLAAAVVLVFVATGLTACGDSAEPHASTFNHGKKPPGSMTLPSTAPTIAPFTPQHSESHSHALLHHSH